MADPLEQQVVEELKNNTAKKNILKKLATPENREDLIWYLNHYPSGNARKEGLWINRFLVAVLLVLTVKKLYFIAMVQLNAAAIHQFSPLLLLDLIVPAINFFVLYKIIRFQRQGYQFMAVLGLLALVRPENRIMPDLAMYLVVTGLAIFLLLRLFPRQENLEDR
jgi:hypothetical protein